MLFDGTWTPKKFRKDCGGREDQENRIRMTILHLYCAWPQTHKFLCWALSESQKADINWWRCRLNHFFNLRIYSLIWDVTVIKNHSVHDQWSSSLFTLRKSKFHREYSIIWSFPALARCTLIPHTGWIFEYD